MELALPYCPASIFGPDLSMSVVTGFSMRAVACCTLSTLVRKETGRTTFETPVQYEATGNF